MLTSMIIFYSLYVEVYALYSSIYGTYFFLCFSFRKEDIVRLLKIWNLTNISGLTIIATMKIGSDYLISSQRASSNGMVCYLLEWGVLCVKLVVDILLLLIYEQNPSEEKSVLIAKMICLETLLKHQWRKH
jgi:hypothetical protein